MASVKSAPPRDSVICFIPIDVTADLGVAIKRVRKKRLEECKILYPERFADRQESNEISSSSAMDNVPESNNKRSHRMNENDSDDEIPKGKSRQNIHEGAEIRRDQFTSIVDYLEAKYSKGVMIDDLDPRVRQTKTKKGNEKNSANLNVFSDSEHGSYYTDDSGGFLDDSDLRIDVAQQILASSMYGTTKIEAEAKKKKEITQNPDELDADDLAFFVNVGDLEMEEGYDSELDDENDWIQSMKIKGKKRKRTQKVPTSKEKSGGSSKEKNGNKKMKDNDKSKALKINAAGNANLAISTMTVAKIQDNKSSATVVAKAQLDPQIENKKEAQALKRKVTKLFNKCVDLIKNQTDKNLPRKAAAKTSKVQVQVPDNKVSGDTVSFSNPHIPGQRLEVKVPDGKVSGDTFIVSVPMPVVLKSNNSENKLSKELIAALDSYSTVYDDWVQAESAYKHLSPKKGEEYKPGVERLKKYDDMLKLFPSELETPIDSAYLRLIVRRRRQNQSKKNKGLVLGSPDKSSMKSSTVIPEKISSGILIPSKGQMFPCIMFNKSDFEHE